MPQEAGDRTLSSPPPTPPTPPNPNPPPPNPSIRVTGVEKKTHKRALPSRKAEHKTRRDVRLGPETKLENEQTDTDGSVRIYRLATIEPIEKALLICSHLLIEGLLFFFQKTQTVVVTAQQFQVH